MMTSRFPACRRRVALLALAAAGAALATSGPAVAYNARVRAACSGDYSRFCPAYAVNSPQLRSCMRSVGRQLSPGCVDALVDAGEISRKQLRRR